MSTDWCMEERCRHRHWRSGSMPTHRRGDDCPPESRSMTGMEHVIEQVAAAVRPVLDAHAWVLDGVCACGLDLGAEHGKYQQARRAHTAEVVARALAEAGLIAPAPLTEEWATRFPNGHLRPGKDRDYDLWFKGDPPKGVNVHRYVTDWLPVDRAEGDGRDKPEPSVPAAQLRAFVRMCVDGGDMTPAAARILDRIIEGDGRAEP